MCLYFSTARATSEIADAVAEPASAVPALGSPCLWDQGLPDQHRRVWGEEVGEHGGVSLPLALCTQKESTSIRQNRESYCFSINSLM